MRNFLFLFLITFAFSAQGQSETIYFADHPALTPDGSSIIFNYEGDLWKASVYGSPEAYRLTAMDGNENHPKISPDGKWLVFSSNQYGNNDLYIMSMNGGNIKQLTFHQANDNPASWSWDSETIYFESSRENRNTTFTISRNGGTPQRLFGHYHNIMHNVAEAPDGALYFNETWESSSFTHRKRYKGAYNPDIKSYHPKDKKYKVHTTYDGKDMWATIDKKGKVFFVSDELNGEYNLYTFDDGQKKRLTDFKSSIHYPTVSANGNLVAFRKDYQLWVYDTKTNKSRALNLQAVMNSTLEKSRDFNVKGNISAFDVSDDGKKMAFVSRGELFVSDIKGKFVRQIATSSTGRIIEVYWKKDSKTILFNQTKGGYQNWYSIAANGKGKEKQHTDDARNNRQLDMNSDKTKAVYLSGRDELRLLDLETMESSLLVKDEFWAFYSDSPQWSPDDAYVTYTAYRDFERDIFIHDIENKKTTNLTKTGISEVVPYWSLDGKYLYFQSNRTEPSYPYGLQDARMYRMSLQKWDAPFRSDKFDELFTEKKKDKDEEKEDKKEDTDNKKENKKDKSDKDKEDKPEKKKKKKKVKVEIDFDELMQRIQRFGPSFGTQGNPIVVKNGKKTTVLFVSNHDEGKFKLYQYTTEPFEKSTTKAIKGAEAGGFSFVTAKDKHYALIRGNIHTLNLGGSKVDKINISYKFRRQLDKEFEQMFYETWANMEENFYNESFHGIDWAAMRDKYAAFLPMINSRANLRLLTNDMLGELNTSHFGFYSNGKEESIYHGTRTLATGIDFEKNNPYIVSGIVKNSPSDKKRVTVKAGDELIAVNGQNVDKSQNRESYFTQPSMDNEISLTFKNEEGEYTMKFHPTSYSSIRNQRYNQWMADCQKRVDEKSDKRIAYVHMKNMSGGQLEHFKEQMISEGAQRDAIILDLRYNTGGNVHDDVLRFLQRKAYLRWKYREGALTEQSNFAPAEKPIILLINEQSLSDAEMTSAGFKQLKLGTIIGTETYRWIIFTSGKGLVDGSFYRLPSWGCYTLEGGNLEQTGVAPDISVDNTFEDRISGNDPQLDRAIEEILKDLKK